MMKTFDFETPEDLVCHSSTHEGRQKLLVVHGRD